MTYEVACIFSGNADPVCLHCQAVTKNAIVEGNGCFCLMQQEYPFRKLTASYVAPWCRGGLSC